MRDSRVGANAVSAGSRARVGVGRIGVRRDGGFVDGVGRSRGDRARAHARGGARRAGHRARAAAAFIAAAAAAAHARGVDAPPRETRGGRRGERARRAVGVPRRREDDARGKSEDARLRHRRPRGGVGRGEAPRRRRRRLRSQPELVERLEKCLPSATEAAPAAEKDEEEEEEAFRLAAEADALTILASEAAAVMDGPAPAGRRSVSRAVARWCRADADNGECALSRWTRRWTMTRVDRGVFAAARSRAHAVVLLAAANAERARAHRAGPPRRPARAPPPPPRRHPRGRRRRRGNGASLARGGGGSRRRRRTARRCARNHRRRRRRRRRGRASSRRMIPWVDFSTRRAIFVSNARFSRRRRRVPRPGAAPNTAGIFCTTRVGWSRRRVARHRETPRRKSRSPRSRLTTTRGWGAPGGPLTVPGREAAEALRAAGRAASRAAARLSVVTAALRFLSVAAGTLPSFLDDDEGDDEGDASATVASAAEREGLLSSWSPKDRAGTVRAALKALDAARAASDEEGAEHAAALAAELADVVALSTRLWARSARERCRTTPAAAVEGARPDPRAVSGSKLDLATNGAASEAETAEEAFELASALASAAASALARPPEAPRGASETLARPLLVAALDSVRAWRAAATARDFPRGFFAESAELGQRLVPLAPALFASGSVAGGGADAALALSILREMASGLVSHAALVEAAGTRALLPPFLPPPPPAIAPAETCAFDDASSLVAAFPFERLGDAPAIALRPFLEASHPAAREPWAAAAEKENARADADANADAHTRSNGGKLGDAEISETRAGAGGAETPAALRLCLALGRSREGAKALQDAGLTDRLADLCASLSQPTYVDAAAATMAVETSGGSNPRRLYCLALRVAATHADASGDARDAGEGARVLVRPNRRSTRGRARAVGVDPGRARGGGGDGGTDARGGGGGGWVVAARGADGPRARASGGC